MFPKVVLLHLCGTQLVRVHFFLFRLYAHLALRSIRRSQCNIKPNQEQTTKIFFQEKQKNTELLAE